MSLCFLAENDSLRMITGPRLPLHRSCMLPHRLRMLAFLDGPELLNMVRGKLRTKEGR